MQVPYKLGRRRTVLRDGEPRGRPSHSGCVPGARADRCLESVVLQRELGLPCRAASRVARSCRDLELPVQGDGWHIGQWRAANGAGPRGGFRCGMWRERLAPQGPRPRCEMGAQPTSARCSGQVSPATLASWPEDHSRQEQDAQVSKTREAWASGFPGTDWQLRASATDCRWRMGRGRLRRVRGGCAYAAAHLALE